MHIRMRIPFFRIWYSTTYTVLFIALIVLLAVTPADTIYQSIGTRQLQKLFSIGGTYLLTFLIVLLIYSTRLYTNRSVLQAIPKPYLPVEDGEVGKLVRRIIVKALRKSAVVAWDSRPRDVRREAGAEEEGEGRPHTAERHHSAFRRRHHHQNTVIPVDAKSPPWGHISHPGWASPSSPDLPNLQYGKVVCELPNLIEAKAVSLAPPDPTVDPRAHAASSLPVLPDAQVVALLQRPQTMGIREYLARLASYGLINPPNLAATFLTQYEYARFSTDPLTEKEFQGLMDIFAGILNGMTELDPAVIDEARSETFDSETRSLAPSESSGSSSSTTSALPYTTPRITQQPDYSDTDTRSAYRHDSESPQTLHTAPSRMRSTSATYTIARTPSEASAGSRSGSVRHHTLQRSPSTILPNSSSSSLRSQGSVVRLRIAPGMGEAPYEYQFDEG
jgi:hypothetical protein